MKRNFLSCKNKSLFVVLICFLLHFHSCQNDESMIDTNGEISSKLLEDPLFEELDKAYYEVNVNMLKYRNEKIDSEKMAKIKEDVKNKKIKSFDEYFTLKEKAGRKDAKKRMLAQIKFNMCQEKILEKYPELRNKKTEFSVFFLKNSKHKLSGTEVIELYQRNTLKK